MPEKRQVVTLQPHAKATFVRLAVILTPVIGHPATYAETLAECERIVRQHLGLSPMPETNLEDLGSPFEHAGLAS